MNLSKKHLEAIKKTFLVCPKGDRRSKFYMVRSGEVEEIDEKHIQRTFNGFLYIRKEALDHFFELCRLVEAELKKLKMTAASLDLAEAVIAMVVDQKRFGPLDYVSVINKANAIKAKLFIGIPAQSAYLSPGGQELLTSWFQIGRFNVGAYAWKQHIEIFGQTKKPPKESDLQDSGLWIAYEPGEVNLVSVAKDGKLRDDVCEYYLTIVTRYLAHLAQKHLEEDQQIPGALMAPTFDVDTIFSMHSLKIDAYYEEYGACELFLLNYHETAIPNNIEQLGSYYEYVSQFLCQANPPCTQLDKIIGIFTESVCFANKLLFEGKDNSAFVHYMFSLDLLLGGHEVNRNISNRAGIILSNVLGRDFFLEKKRLGALYSIRSKFVHEGTAVPPGKNEELRQICKILTEVLIRLRYHPEANKKKFLEDVWLKRLDFLAYAANAGIELHASYYVACGFYKAGAEESRILH